MVTFAKTIEIKSIGKFEIASGMIRVSDPCYDKDAWCADTVPAKNGIWQASIVMFDEGEWGNRVGYLIAYHKDFPVDQYSHDWQRVDFEIGVDSGQAGIFDDGFFKDDESVKGLKRLYNKSICEEIPWYSICCDRTLHKGLAGVIPYGAISSSGYGDGRYDYYVRKNAYGDVIAVMIDFGLEGDEEDG